MKKLLMTLVLFIGLSIITQPLFFFKPNTIMAEEQHKKITLFGENGPWVTTIVPVDFPDFFKLPYEIEVPFPITNNFIALGFRNKLIFEDIYIVGIAIVDGQKQIVNFMRGLDDTYYVYSFSDENEQTGPPKKVTEEEFNKNIYYWAEKTKDVNDLWYQEED